MADPTPAPAVPDPSFSIEVPSHIAGVDSSTYLRVGARDLSSAREDAYYSAGAKPKAGVLMLSPTDLVQVSDSSVSFKTSAEALTVSAASDKVISATYSFEETGTFRDASYKYSRSTSWSMGDSQTFKAANNTDISVTNDQKLSVATGFTAKMGLDSTISFGPLSIAIDQKGIDVKAPLLGGGYKSTTADSTEGGSALTLTLNPLNAVYLAKIEGYLTTMRRLTAVIAVLGATPIIAMGGMAMATPVKDGKVSDSDIADLKQRLGLLGKSGWVEIGALTILQIAAGLLGSMAVIQKAAAAIDPLLPRIEMTPGRIKFSVGLTSVIEMTAIDIGIQAGPNTSLTMGAVSGDFVAPTVALKGGGFTSQVECAAASLSLSGTATRIMATTLMANADAVTIRGTATVSIGAPAISFSA